MRKAKTRKAKTAKAKAAKTTRRKAATSKTGGGLKAFRGTLVLVGAGKMGGALLDGWLARGLDRKSVV